VRVKVLFGFYKKVGYALISQKSKIFAQSGPPATWPAWSVWGNFWPKSTAVVKSAFGTQFYENFCAQFLHVKISMR